MFNNKKWVVNYLPVPLIVRYLFTLAKWHSVIQEYKGSVVVTSELQSAWKEEIVTKSQYLPGGTNIKHENRTAFEVSVEIKTKSHTNLSQELPLVPASCLTCEQLADCAEMVKDLTNFVLFLDSLNHYFWSEFVKSKRHFMWIRNCVSEKILT
jgi:hypothetical protein